MTRAKWWLIALVVTVLVGISSASVAYAHAELLEAYPPIGAQWRWTRPSEIRLTFSQEVALEGSSVRLLNHQFQQQPLGTLQQDPNDKTTLVVPIPEQMLSGTYTVDWQTLSVDGHNIQGAYDFTLFPRESLITAVVAPIVLVVFGLFVWSRRARD